MIFFEECHRIRRETVARNIEANVELQQLRENVSQYSAAASLNEVFRTQLHSMQQELISERLQSNKDRMHLEEKINKLKTDIHDEKAKCKRFNDEKLLKNTVIMKLEDRLKKTECDKQFFQQQLHQLNARLATFECELQMYKDNFEESNKEIILLRAERDKLMETCEILSKENELRNEIEIQLHHAQENNRNLLGQLKENDKSLEVAEEETLDHIKTQNVTLSEISLASDKLLKLQEELEIEKHERAELAAKFGLATAQLEQLDRKTDGLSITSVTQESHVIRNNHQFLVENIKSGPLVDLLHEKQCITDEERDYLSNQPNNFYRNDALLHWMRKITFKQGKGLKVLECFRQSDQNFVVDLLSKGGVLVKSKMSTKLAKERQSLGLFAKTSSENVKALKEKEAMVIETLNQRQGVPLSNNENATSDIADDEIIITPFCHQEDNGIVVWFWCQSKNAQRNLQSIYLYSSDILLGKLVTIFKTFSNGSVSSDSELLVPTGITIYMADFTKNEKIVDFEADPKLLLKIKRNTAEKTYEGIRAFAVLADEIFAIIKKNSEVEVYNRTSLQFQRRFTVDNLKEPRDIVSCSRNNCLYIIDGKPLGQPMEILRVDIINGNILKKVWQGNDWGRLSVTNESNLILAVLDKSKLLEITPDGQLVRETMLTIPNPRHAVKLTSDRFVVAYERCPGGGICITNNKGKLLMSSSHKVLDSADFFPVNVAVNKDGSLLVADVDGGRILLLTSTLKYQRELLFIPKKHGLRHPRMLFVDESNGRLLVCEDRLNGGRILVFDMAG